MKKELKKHPLAVAWDEWLASDDGQACTTGDAEGIYLENRLARAFQAGAAAGELYAIAARLPKPKGGK